MPVKPSPNRRSEIPFAVTPPRPEVRAVDVLRRPDFVADCEARGVEPTMRQARKYLARRNDGA